MHTPFQGLSTLFSIHGAKELDRDLIFCLEDMVFHSPRAAPPVLNSCLLQDKPMVPGTSQETFSAVFRPSVWAHTMVPVSEGLAHNLCWTQLEWFKVLLISSCLSCPSPGDEGMSPSCSAAAAASPTYHLKSTLAGAWCQEIRLRMWKWVKTVQAERQVESCAWEYLKTTL